MQIMLSNRITVFRAGFGARSHMSSPRPNKISKLYSAAEEANNRFGWEIEAMEDVTGQPNVKELRLDQIRRPHTGIRSNNQDKVQALKLSIQEYGLKEPIDILEVDGQYYGFNGCHRFQAHQELGKETILCKVRKANKQILKFHMM